MYNITVRPDYLSDRFSVRKICNKLVTFKANQILERTGLILKQGEWNILQMGTAKYLTNCKRLRLKNVYLETVGLADQKTIPLMTDQTIDVSYR